MLLAHVHGIWYCCDVDSVHGHLRFAANIHTLYGQLYFAANTVTVLDISVLLVTCLEYCTLPFLFCRYVGKCTWGFVHILYSLRVWCTLAFFFPAGMHKVHWHLHFATENYTVNRYLYFADEIHSVYGYLCFVADMQSVYEHF